MNIQPLLLRWFQIIFHICLTISLFLLYLVNSSPSFNATTIFCRAIRKAGIPADNKFSNKQNSKAAPNAIGWNNISPLKDVSALSNKKPLPSEKKSKDSPKPVDIKLLITMINELKETYERL